MNNMDILRKKNENESLLLSNNFNACIEIPNPNNNEKIGKNFV